MARYRPNSQGCSKPSQAAAVLSNEVVGATGLQAPGFPSGIVFGQADNQFYGPLTGIDIDDSGRIALTGAVRGSGIELENDEAVWIEGENGLEILVKEGDRVPGGRFPKKAIFQSGSVIEGAFVSSVGPRIKIVSTGFALNANNLDGKDSTDFIDTTSNQVRTGDLHQRKSRLKKLVVQA